ncbi:MAG: cysteine desulfurase NifS [Deltaproteobacteria bacterium]|nr:cysteine desulfurase NifS [Deltaproteobacteria bacterium]
MKNVYMDNNATTPVRAEVREKVLPFLGGKFGNPSSVHWAGRAAHAALDEAREHVARILGAKDREVVFTGSGSEADNMAIKGACFALRKKGKHIITTAVEHPAVLETCRDLEKHGADVTYLPVKPDGTMEAAEVGAAIRDDTVLVTIMFANNETGVVFPIKEIGAVTRKKGVLFHTDAVQAVGKLPIRVEELGVDMLSLSGHKLYAPKGVGALYIRSGVRIERLISGGHQERNRRAGTENIPGIAGLGEAARLAAQEIDEESARTKRLRDRLERGIFEKVPRCRRNGHPERRLPNTSNISFEYIEGEGILLSLDMEGVAASSGSACTSGSLDPSHVLLAMGLSHELAHGSVRLSLGRDNTDAEVDHVLSVLPGIAERLRAMSPLYNRRPEERPALKYEELACSTHAHDIGDGHDH